MLAHLTPPMTGETTRLPHALSRSDRTGPRSGRPLRRASRSPCRESPPHDVDGARKPGRRARDQPPAGWHNRPRGGAKRAHSLCREGSKGRISRAKHVKTATPRQAVKRGSGLKTLQSPRDSAAQGRRSGAHGTPSQARPIVRACLQTSILVSAFGDGGGMPGLVWNDGASTVGLAGAIMADRVLARRRRPNRGIVSCPYPCPRRSIRRLTPR